MSTTAELLDSLKNKITTLGKKVQTSNDYLVSLIDRSVTNIVIPVDVVHIGSYAFKRCTNLESVTFHDDFGGVIGVEAFNGCTSLKSLYLGKKFYGTGESAFAQCTALETVVINTKKDISLYPSTFYGCTSLKSITLSKGIWNIGFRCFYGCTSLEFINLEDGFRGQPDFSATQKLSLDTIVAMFTALADRTGQTANKLTLNTVYGDLLSADQIAIATAKNWTIAFAG